MITSLVSDANTGKKRIAVTNIKANWGDKRQAKSACNNWRGSLVQQTNKPKVNILAARNPCTAP